MALFRGTAWHTFAALGVAGAACAWATSASAGCAAPEPRLMWSYPDASTEIVPTDARFFALVAPQWEGDLSLELDGQPLARVRPDSDVPLERAQFAPPSELAGGEHELTVTIRAPQAASGAEASSEPLDQHRFAFSVARQAPRTPSARIADITRYDARYTPGPQLPELVPDVEDPHCGGRLLDTSLVCNDGGPSGFWTRVELEPLRDDGVLGYLVNGMLVPPDCRVFFPYAARANGGSFEVAAVVPTGVLPATPFEDEVVLVTDPARHARADNASGGCAVYDGAGSSMHGVLRALTFVGAMLALGWRRRRA